MFNGAFSGYFCLQGYTGTKLRTVILRVAILCALSIVSLSLNAEPSAFTASDNMYFSHVLSQGQRRDPSLFVGSINSISRDSQGYMWFGGANGLLRYNAYNFRVYQPVPGNPNSLSSGNITDMLVDHGGVLWFATANGLARYNENSDDFTRFSVGKDHDSRAEEAATALAIGTDNRLYVGAIHGLRIYGPDRLSFTAYPRFSNDTKDADANNVTDLVIDQHERLWISTRAGGLYLFDEGSGTFQNWNTGVSSSPRLLTNHVESLSEDQDGNIWIVEKGEALNKFNYDTQTFTRYRHNKEQAGSLASNEIRKVYVDSANRIWQALDHGGLSLYLAETDSFRVFDNNPADKHSLSSNQLRALYEDPLGDLWIGTFSHGVNMHSASQYNFNILTHNPSDENSLPHNGILDLHEDKEGLLWIGTENGLSSYQNSSGRYKHYKHEPTNPESLRFNAVVSIEDDPNGNLWVGTWSGGLHYFDKSLGRFKRYFPDVAKEDSFPSMYAWTMERDSKGVLWIGSSEDGGLIEYNGESDSFKNYTHVINDSSTIAANQVWDILEDSRGYFWVATLNGLDRFDRKNKNFYHYRFNKDKENTLPSNQIRVIYEDSQGVIWVGTDGHGVARFNYVTNDFTKIKLDDTNAPLSVSSIIEDKLGNLWFGTLSGLIKLDRESGTVSRLMESDGLSGNVFNRNASHIDRDGILYFGGTEGITYFDPNTLQLGTAQAPIVFSKFTVLEHEVSLSDPEFITHFDIDENYEPALQLNIRHGHSMFSIEYALLNYRGSESNSYQYRLEGHDSDWVESGTSRRAVYVNIPNGLYRFSVRAQSNGVSVDSESTMLIRVYPPLWLTWWAILIYVFVTFFMIYIVNSLRTRHVRRERRREREHHEKLVRIDRLKNAFLANTSHELKTPLNGIVSTSEAVAEYIRREKFDEAIELLSLIQVSGKRLNMLVSDLFDFSKISDGSLKLNFEKVFLDKLVSELLLDLNVMARDKGVVLESRILDSFPAVYADKVRLHKILYCLIENAIKYTREVGGRVNVYCELHEGKAKIFVNDQGIGIAEKALSTIFDTFSQVDFSESRISDGMGLGLATTKHLVHLHGGEISVRSRIGEGSVFSITIPLYRYHSLEVGGTRIHAYRRSQLSVLVVDDEVANRMVIGALLEQESHILFEADSGPAALDFVQSHENIDVILLDIMMPRMSGIEVCEQLRETYSKEQLPIVFVTAMNLDEAKDQCKASGGNAVLTKPVTRDGLNEVLQVFMKPD
ncbi:MAG: two-component system sensor histidine kinase ChiS [Flavobacteriales bacterium]